MRKPILETHFDCALDLADHLEKRGDCGACVALLRRVESVAVLEKFILQFLEVTGEAGNRRFSAPQLRHLAWQCQSPLDCSEKLRDVRDVLESLADVVEGCGALTIQE